LKEIKFHLNKVNSPNEFNDLCLKIFDYQYKNNLIYAQYVDLLLIQPHQIKHYTEIPFLPISFFKTKKVVSFKEKEEVVFKSSGTTSTERSQHFVKSKKVYKESFLSGFNYFYGNPQKYCFLALLPSYVEQGDSSLVFMVNELISQSECTRSGFYQNEEQVLSAIREVPENNTIFLIGVSYALLRLVQNQQKMNLSNAIVMETGGMKGREKEITRKELHQKLKEGLGVSTIHSEYGMTELLSQAYSKGEGIFQCPPWMKLLARDLNAPLNTVETGSGAINVIDLYNVDSCSFIATEDLGIVHQNGQFEILGRIDNSDIRGCNLLNMN
jgi:hypothetical protein